MNKKTLKILIASIAGVLVLALVAALLAWKVFPALKKHDKGSSGKSESTVETVSSQPSEGGEAENTDSTDNTGSKGGTGNTSSAGGAKGDKAVAVDATISVEDVSAKKGQVIKVPVKIEKNPGIMACMLQFEFDTNSLEYLGYEQEGFFSQYQDHAEGNSVNIIMLSDGDVTKDGTILSLKFTVKDTAAASSAIKVSAKDAGVGNLAEEWLEPKFVNGTVTVK